MLAGETAAAFCSAGEGEGVQFLKDYDVKWRDKFASDLRGMGLARKLFASLSDETLTRLFRVLQDHVSEIEEAGDMDFQGKIISRMLRKRELAALLPRIAADSVRAIFS